jgi:predicted metal-dependent phosphotriesterase family hydrolase
MSDEPIYFKNNIVHLGSKLAYNKIGQKLYFKEYKIYNPIKKIIKITYENSKIVIKTFNTRNRVGYTMIHLADGRVILANDEVVNSTIIQLGVFENYNADLFEPVVLSPIAKVYRVKRSYHNK